MISSFPALRFFNALLIFCHHENSFNNLYLTAIGPSAVSFFFFLSGFSMSIGYYKKVLSQDFTYARFMQKRIVRVGPLHLLCFLLYMGLNYKSIESLMMGGGMICNLFFVQSWIPKPAVYFSGNAVEWCLSDLMFFYAAFPFVIRLLQGKVRTLVFTALYSMLYVLCIIFCPERYVHAVVYINPMCRFLDFYLGILLYRMYMKFKGRFLMSHLVAVLAQSSALLVSVAAVCFYGYVNERLRYSCLFFVPSTLVLLSFSVFDGYGFAKMLSNRTAFYLGGISFTFYMLHQLGISFVSLAVAKLGVNLGFVSKVIMQFCFDLVGSVAVHHFFEKPVARNLCARFLHERQ